MPTWIDVHRVNVPTAEQFNTDILGRADTTVLYYAEASDSFVSIDLAQTASFGGVTIPVARESFSVTRPLCVVVSIQAKRLSPRQFQITINYKDPTDGTATTAAELLAKSAKITPSYNEDEEEYTFDTTGKWVASSAGQPYDKFPTRTRARKIYTIQKYVDAATRVSIEDAVDKINTADVTIDGFTVTARHGKFASHGDTPVDGVVGVWSATYEVQDLKRPWDDEIIDNGFRELGGGGVHETIPILEADQDGNDVPVSKPWPLDGAGNALPTTYVQADLVKITFKPYYDAAWTGVPLA